MARPWRVQFKGAVYHVVARGNNRQDIFIDDHGREVFLDLLSRASDRYKLEIFAFCLMTNHYHLLLRTPDANLSAAMQWINTTHAVRFKIRHSRSGHFFQGRFKSVLVEAEPHWQYLTFYIHINPVRARMVESPSQYKWSSYRDYTRPNSRFSWLCRDEILLNLGRNKAERRSNYRRKCMELAKKKPDFWKDARESVIMGSQEFIDMVRKKFSPSFTKEEVTDYRKVERQRIDPEKELEKLAAALKIDAELFKKRADGLPARLLAYHHLVERRGMSQTSVGKYFNVSGNAVSMGIRRLKTLAEKERKIKNLMEMCNVKV
jgi:putative transposase